MRVTLKLADGSEQVHDVANLLIDIGGWPLELIERTPGTLSHHIEGFEKQWASLSIHPRAANSIDVEVKTHGDDPVPSPGTPGEG